MSRIRDGNGSTLSSPHPAMGRNIKDKRRCPARASHLSMKSSPEVGWETKFGERMSNGMSTIDQSAAVVRAMFRQGWQTFHHQPRFATGVRQCTKIFAVISTRQEMQWCRVVRALEQSELTQAARPDVCGDRLWAFYNAAEIKIEHEQTTAKDLIRKEGLFVSRAKKSECLKFRGNRNTLFRVAWIRVHLYRDPRRSWEKKYWPHRGTTGTRYLSIRRWFLAHESAIHQEQRGWHPSPDLEDRHLWKESLEKLVKCVQCLTNLPERRVVKYAQHRHANERYLIVYMGRYPANAQFDFLGERILVLHVLISYRVNPFKYYFHAIRNSDSIENFSLSDMRKFSSRPRQMPLFPGNLHVGIQFGQ
ncbi:hypothetical protein DFH08DRAFT_928969 [Mycena albidolilacea]|uniref:Uncharacterized protein n=1 Tax=Mycena albidolilacea TaxID=1033008 RepID=A0AAD7AW94_9AGAR|nr:hypothetical protein DFH08DRAFT_928969 [Mycena albidolilacea]